MAIFAGGINMFPGQLESCQVVIEQSRFPARWRMACRAVCPKASGMWIFCSVTRKTITGCAFENPILMAVFAGDIGMFTFKFEIGQVMVKHGWFPTSG